MENWSGPITTEKIVKIVQFLPTKTQKYINDFKVKSDKVSRHWYSYLTYVGHKDGKRLFCKAGVLKSDTQNKPWNYTYMERSLNF